MKSTIILRKLNMSKFIFRAFGETETEKQAQTYCEKGADLRVQFTDQVREAWVGANL